MEFNLADLWERVVDEIPDHEALVCGDRRLTYAEADARATRLAHHLAGAGIGAGDHVALYLYKDLPLLVALQPIYIALSIWGWVDWRRSMAQVRAEVTVAC